jgi:hypothetical protein
MAEPEGAAKWRAEGARWEIETGWVWRGCEPPHAPPPRQPCRWPTQLWLKFTAAASPSPPPLPASPSDPRQRGRINRSLP